MTLKPHKCEFKSFGKTSRNDVFCLNKAASKKLHGIAIDNHLTFNRDITNICKSAKRKLNAQSRVSSLLAKNSERFYQNRLFNRCKSQLLSSYLDVQFCQVIQKNQQTTEEGFFNIHRRGLYDCLKMIIPQTMVNFVANKALFQQLVIKKVYPAYHK